MSFYRLFYPRQTCFLAASYEDKPNVTVIDWLMPVSLKPPMVALALNNNSQSLELLSRSKEFTISIMPEKTKETAALVGATTGRLIDKVEEYKIALVKSRRVEAPILKDALGSVECIAIQIMTTGDHSIVVGEVVETHYPEDDDKAPILFNWGNKSYFGMEYPTDKGAYKEGKKKEPTQSSIGQIKEKENFEKEKNKPQLQLSASGEQKNKVQKAEYDETQNKS